MTGGAEVGRRGETQYGLWLSEVHREGVANEAMVVLKHLVSEVLRDGFAANGPSAVVLVDLPISLTDAVCGDAESTPESNG